MPSCGRDPLAPCARPINPAAPLLSSPSHFSSVSAVTSAAGPAIRAVVPAQPVLRRHLGGAQPGHPRGRAYHGMRRPPGSSLDRPRHDGSCGAAIFTSWQSYINLVKRPCDHIVCACESAPSATLPSGRSAWYPLRPCRLCTAPLLMTALPHDLVKLNIGGAHSAVLLQADQQPCPARVS